MSVTFGIGCPSGFQSAIRQKVYELQVSRNPNVEWTWRFSALAVGTSIGVALTIPPKTEIPGLDGWGEGREFHTNIPTDVDAACAELSAWFKTIHIQFRRENKDSLKHILDDEAMC
jgi:hypothetical protein